MEDKTAIWRREGKRERGMEGGQEGEGDGGELQVILRLFP